MGSMLFLCDKLLIFKCIKLKSLLDLKERRSNDFGVELEYLEQKNNAQM